MIIKVLEPLSPLNHKAERMTCVIRSVFVSLCLRASSRPSPPKTHALRRVLLFCIVSHCSHNRGLSRWLWVYCSTASALCGIGSTAKAVRIPRLRSKEIRLCREHIRTKKKRPTEVSRWGLKRDSKWRAKPELAGIHLGADAVEQ